VIGDKSLYQKIGQTIYNASPDGSVKLIMNASLAISSEGNVGTFEFDYVDQEGNKKWFPFGANIDTASLQVLLTQLRQSYIDDGQLPWYKCEFILDVATGNFEFNIDYESASSGSGLAT